MDAVARLRRWPGLLAGGALVAGGTALLGPGPARRTGVPRPLSCVAVALGGAIVANELTGRPVPFLRWSFLRLLVGIRHFARTGQIGDGREEAFARYLVAHARPGDVDDAIRTADEFCRTGRILAAVGDEKGPILERAVAAAHPHRILELGTYCGYSALRMTRATPSDAHLYSVEFNAANADIARRVIAHAGVADRVTVVVGSLGDGGGTLQRLRDDHGFSPGSLDLVFLDHDKDRYLADLELVLESGWLHPGSVVVADNVLVPGAPAYRAYMAEHEGGLWHTTEHPAHVEYQSLVKDLVLESEYRGG
ncbi:O-methyltransferase [Pseudonocardia yuanmonensis]|uniref:O-methyltransferase n=1 Tax=Pseudonocardia yuanmonensis TaxID=1095914 RepID=A0ABP8XMX2_9PSEU